MRTAKSIGEEIQTRLEVLFPGKEPLVENGKPTDMVRFIPQDSVGKCVSDGEFFVNHREPLQKGEEWYCPILVDKDAAYFVWWNNDAYIVYFVRDVDVDKIAAAVKQRLEELALETIPSHFP